MTRNFLLASAAALPPSRTKKIWRHLVIALMFCFGLSGVSACATATHRDGDSLLIYATTGYLGDVAHRLAPEATVVIMVGPGADPHTYQPSTQDIATMQKSDLVLWNGLELEAQMSHMLRDLTNQFAVGENIDPAQLITLPAGDDGEVFDPHIWNSATIWLQVIGDVAQQLSEIDPDNSAAYQRQARAYQAELTAVHAEVSELMRQLPLEKRTVITGHDAFGYFGREYQLEIFATDFISTTAQLSAAELSGLADLIVSRKVTVIFQDDQANPQAITALQEAVRSRGQELEIASEPLYADTLGAADHVDTHLKVLKHNAHTIFQHLNSASGAEHD